MTDRSYSIAILGAGPVGRALALLLARGTQDPTRILLIQARPSDGPARAGHSAGLNASGSSSSSGSPGNSAGPDARVLALNHGSLVLLDALGARPAPAASIHSIHVSQRTRLGQALIRHTDFNVPELGAVAVYPAVQEALARAVASSGVTVLEAAGAHVARQDAQAVSVRTADGQTLRCAVAALSDGNAAGRMRREYGQDAVLATVRAALPRSGWAFERFTREGPLALLPHPAGGGCYAVVWCCAPERARALAQLDDAAFGQALTEAFGERLGALTSVAQRHIASLSMSLRPAQVAGRTVAVGNAAQTLHPVAGQGLNLGLRDAATLAQTLVPWLARPDLDPGQALRRFSSARRSDRWLTASLTDLLPRVFATGLAPLEHACGLGLLALDLARPLRAPLARHLLQGWRS